MSTLHRQEHPILGQDKLLLVIDLQNPRKTQDTKINYHLICQSYDIIYIYIYIYIM